MDQGSSRGSGPGAVEAIASTPLVRAVEPRPRVSRWTPAISHQRVLLEDWKVAVTPWRVSKRASSFLPQALSRGGSTRDEPKAIDRGLRRRYTPQWLPRLMRWSKEDCQMLYRSRGPTHARWRMSIALFAAFIGVLGFSGLASAAAEHHAKPVKHHTKPVKHHKKHPADTSGQGSAAGLGQSSGLLPSEQADVGECDRRQPQQRDGSPADLPG